MPDLDEQWLAKIEPHQADWLRARMLDGTVGASRTGQPFVTQRGWEIILEVGAYEFPEDSDPLTIEFVQEARRDGDIAALWDAIEYLSGMLFAGFLLEVE